MRVGIVGSGFVGSAAAYAMVMRGVGREIVLVDANLARAQAEADDIFHAVPFAHALDVQAGDYSDLRGCRIVIFAAGANQKPGETRLQLLGRNAEIFRQIVPQVVRHAPDAIFLVATNPVDIMTHFTARVAAEHGIPSNRVLGSGTTLDTARFRALVARHVGVDAPHIHAYVVGEHGDSEVLLWSSAMVGGVPLQSYCQARGVALNAEVMATIDEQVRRAAYHIISGKGATYYGIGSALARICEVILGNERAILTVCTPHAEVAGVADVTVALPHLLGGEGIIDQVPLQASDEERALLGKSALVIRNYLDQLGWAAG
jgi:L-lactate dehydrogenase